MVLTKVITAVKFANIHSEKEVISHLLDALEAMGNKNVESFERRLKRAFDASKIESVWNKILEVKHAHDAWKASEAVKKPEFEKAT